MKRRQLLSLTAATSLTFPAILRAQEKRFSGITLRMNGYGGVWDSLMIENIAQPLERKTGLKVTMTPGTTSGALAKLLALPDDPAFDIVMMDSPAMPDLVRTQAVRPVT